MMETSRLSVWSEKNMSTGYSGIHWWVIWIIVFPLLQALGILTRCFFQRGHCEGTRPWTGRAAVEIGCIWSTASVTGTDGRCWWMLIDDVGHVWSGLGWRYLRCKTWSGRPSGLYIKVFAVMIVMWFSLWEMELRGRGKCCLMKILRPRIQSLKYGDAKAPCNPGWLQCDCQELPQVCQSLSCISLQLEKVRRFTEMRLGICSIRRFDIISLLLTKNC